jgi:AraC-like DNA-binding protein
MTLDDITLTLMKVSVSIIRDIIYSAVANGANMHTICQAIAIRPEWLQEQKAYEVETVQKLWQAAIEETHDPLLGLHIGEKANFESIGIVGFTLQNSLNLSVALERGVYYNNLYSSMVEISLHKEPLLTKVVFEPAWFFLTAYPHAARQSVESSMSFLVTALRKLSGKNIAPLLASFGFATPDASYLPEYEKLFRSKMVFNEEQSSLLFTGKDLQAGVLSYNKELFTVLDEQADRLLKAYGNKLTYTEKVKHSAIKLLQSNFLTIEQVAGELHLSVRTLQRKLKKEGSSFLGIIDEIHKEVALGYLKENHLSISQIAYLLGYAEASVFSRAFKRWTGSYPTEYKNKALVD